MYYLRALSVIGYLGLEVRRGMQHVQSQGAHTCFNALFVLLKFLIFEQGAPQFHFALDPANSVAMH